MYFLTFNIFFNKKLHMNTLKNKTIVLTKKHVNHILENIGLDDIMDQLIEHIEAAFIAFNPELTSIPIRSGFNYANENPGLIELMPLYQKNKAVTLKVVGYHPKNPSKYNLPTILSTISNYDTQTGHLKGLVDGVLLTALRTGATSALASKYLAHPASETLGLIGCGAQAVTQLHGISRLFNLKKVLLYDTDYTAIKSFKERCEILNLPILFKSASLSEIVATSDIICTATSINIGEGPLFNNMTNKPHTHINAVGADFPGKTEIPIALLRKSLVVPDFLEQAVIEGECQQLNSTEIGPTLATIIKNSDNYQHAKVQSTVFDSTGWALEDQVAMDLFMTHAAHLNIGLKLDIENTAKDTKNPYHYLVETVEI